MAVNTKIKAVVCSVCGKDLSHKSSRWCCQKKPVEVEREKQRITGMFKVVDWFSSRSSACLVIEREEGGRFYLYMSDVFKYLNGHQLGSLTLEETKKGSAYGWRVEAKGARNSDEKDGEDDAE
ncbi:hypothetical protein ACFOQM_23520 [Paenibacillus sp. GCM10012307]|uniref:Uncharacterized protein n=1 Tax=Paenibacillus roseus TaxID=2798579 RepID=A0A934MSQ9_9BACL|nr:hypothetical protein [Paenibacillus roseus]MBJ6364193.1 hypothetical protein [Paenibacillus roseus]